MTLCLVCKISNFYFSFLSAKVSALQRSVPNAFLTSGSVFALNCIAVNFLINLDSSKFLKLANQPRCQIQNFVRIEVTTETDPDIGKCRATLRWTHKGQQSRFECKKYLHTSGTHKITLIYSILKVSADSYNFGIISSMWRRAWCVQIKFLFCDSLGAGFRFPTPCSECFSDDWFRFWIELFTSEFFGRYWFFIWSAVLGTESP